MSSHGSKDNVPISQMIAELRARTTAFNEKFSSLKSEYDELSEKQSDVLQDVERQTNELHQCKEQYAEALENYKMAKVDKLNAEIDVHLSLNTPQCLIYSPKTKPGGLANIKQELNYRPLPHLIDAIYI